MAKRTKIKTEWDLSLILPKADKKTVEKEMRQIERATNAFVKKWKGRKDYLTKPAVLKKALDDFEKWSSTFSGGGAANFYFHLALTLDQQNADLKGRVDVLNDFSTKQFNKLRFFILDLATIKTASQKKFVNSKILQEYKGYLKRQFMWAPYRLTEKEENIFSLLSGPAHGHWVRMQDTLLSKSERTITLKNKKEVVQIPKLLSLLEDSDKRVRDHASAAINSILLENRDTAEAELNAILNTKKIEDEIRGLSMPETSRIMGDEISQKTVDALTSVVSSKYEIPEKYYALKAKILGQKRLQYHERFVPIGKENSKFSFIEGAKIVGGTLHGLNPEFSKIFYGMARNGQIDVYPKKGKDSGGFCVSNKLVDPVFVFLNWTNNITDVFTLAHEFGHAIHFTFAKKQNAFNKGATTASGEVASTFMEDFVFAKLKENLSDEGRFNLMTQKFERQIATIFRQIAAFEFERELHTIFRKKGYLSHSEIGTIFKKHMSSYMGAYVEQSEGSENWWIYWSHFRNFFYVYSYASGLLISMALQRRVKKDPAAIKDFVEFISLGRSQSTEEIFKSIGIDITKKSFWEEGLKEVEEQYDEIFLLAKKLKKI